MTGQDGAYLAELLLAKGYRVHGIKRRSSLFNTDRIDHLYQDPHVDDQRFSLPTWCAGNTRPGTWPRCLAWCAFPRSMRPLAVSRSTLSTTHGACSPRAAVKRDSICTVTISHSRAAALALAPAVSHAAPWICGQARWRGLPD